MNNAWEGNNWGANEDVYNLPEMPIEPRKPDVPTKLVDIATEAEEPKKYISEEKAFQERKENGVDMNEPVEIHEPAFRSDMYEVMVKYFKEKREIKARNAELRRIMGMRG